MRLRDKCVQEPLKRGTIQNFLNLWDKIMMQPSAHALSQTDMERLFFESVQHCQYADLQHEIRFYREGPMHSRTQAALRRRIDRVLFDKEVADSRKAAEKAMHESLSLNPTPKRGNAGKQPKEPKKPGQPKAELSGGDAAFKEQLAHEQRQKQALAAQVRDLGGKPVFVPKPGKTGTKGDRSRSPPKSDAGSGKS